MSNAMSYANYVFAAYAVFAAFLAWDYLEPRLQLVRIRRVIVLRIQREKIGRAAVHESNP